MAFGDKSVSCLSHSPTAAGRRCLVPCQGINLHPPIKLIGKREKKEKEAAIPRLGEGFSLAPSTSSMYSKFGDNVEVEMSEFWESVRCEDRLK